MNDEIKKPVSNCCGITNRCEDGQYILFADYDKVYFATLLKELDSIFKRFSKHLTQFAILESSPSILTQNGTLGSYHVISFGKMPYQKMREVLSYMTVDDAFFKLPANTPYRTNTLRISPKFTWVEQFDKETDEGLGNQKILKDEPRFLTWFPDVENVPEVEVSEGHIRTYEHMLNSFRFPERFTLYKLDHGVKIELKQYDSLKG